MSYSVADETIIAERFIEFLNGNIGKLVRSLILLHVHVSFHHAQLECNLVRPHRQQLGFFFLPKRTPEFNPYEQVWKEFKNHRIEQKPFRNWVDLKYCLIAALDSVENNVDRVASFFRMSATRKICMRKSPLINSGSNMFFGKTLVL